MTVRKLTSTDGFLITDLDNASMSVGIIRTAPKVLLDGATLLARATTYSFATFGVQACGASAGVNAKPDARDSAVNAAIEELAPLVGDGSLSLTAGTGMTAADLAPWGQPSSSDGSLAERGAVAAAEVFLPEAIEWADASVGVMAPASWRARVQAAWTAAGGSGEVVEATPNTDVDVLFVAGKAGLIDDDLAAGIVTRLVVPLTPVPVTAKAYAVLSRAGVVLVPDAVSCAGPLLAVADPAGDDPIARITAIAGDLAPDGVNAWRSMVSMAETFLLSWQPSLPFGRPLA